MASIESKSSVRVGRYGIELEGFEAMTGCQGNWPNGFEAGIQGEGGQMAGSTTIWTIGHSNRSIEAFLEVLADQSIGRVADVRRFPGSRLHPQFNQGNLEASLREAGIGYRHFPGLGGRRTERAGQSPNTAWRVEAFNAYADYMLTDAFQQALTELTAAAQATPTAIMCAEALPWRCHRRLIADALLALGWAVLDILGVGNARPHELPGFAKVVEGRVTYPGEVLFGND